MEMAFQDFLRIPIAVILEHRFHEGRVRERRHQSTNKRNRGHGNNIKVSMRLMIMIDDTRYIRVDTVIFILLMCVYIKYT